MITNEKQWRISRTQAARFDEALKDMGESDGSMSPVLWKAQRDALASQLESLRAEIAEYEARCSLPEEG